MAVAAKVNSLLNCIRLIFAQILGLTIGQFFNHLLLFCSFMNAIPDIAMPNSIFCPALSKLTSDKHNLLPVSGASTSGDQLSYCSLVLGFETGLRGFKEKVFPSFFVGREFHSYKAAFRSFLMCA